MMRASQAIPWRWSGGLGMPERRTAGGKNIMKVIDPGEFQTATSNLKFPMGQELEDVVTTAIDAYIEKGTIKLDSQNSDKLHAESGATTTNTLPEKEAAIGKVQEVFAKTGISLAFCGEDHNYKYDRTVIEPRSEQYQLMKDWIVTGELDPGDADYLRRKQARARMKSNVRAQQQVWDKSAQDRSRAETLQYYVRGDKLAVDMVFFERGMIYPKVPKEVREEAILKNGFKIKQRSALVAAYLFLCVAGGDQTGDDRIIFFFGAEHADVLTAFEHLVLKSTHVPWVRKRKRHYCSIPTHV